MIQKPIALIQGSYSQDDVDALKAKSIEIIDIYEQQMNELFRIAHPSKAKDSEEYEKFASQRPAGSLAGAWVYYPWNSKLLHCLEPKGLYALRTNRNKNLITDSEQLKMSEAVVGVAGMSVGAGIASAIIYSGMSNTIKIADFDELDTSNLNRLRESLLSVGKKKVDLAAQHLYELDPFLDVRQFDEGLNDANLDSFFQQPKLSVVIDEIDDFKMKIKLRLHAKKHRIPLLMFTSLGDNILVDVERYDTTENLQPLHGLIGNVADEIMKLDEITPEDIRQLSVKVVGPEYVPTKALSSVMEMGRTLVGRPQLYGTIAVDGGLAAYVVRLLTLGNTTLSGRYFIKFAELFNQSNTDTTDSPQRLEIINKLFT